MRVPRDGGQHRGGPRGEAGGEGEGREGEGEAARGAAHSGGGRAGGQEHEQGGEGYDRAYARGGYGAATEDFETGRGDVSQVRAGGAEEVSRQVHGVSQRLIKLFYVQRSEKRLVNLVKHDPGSVRPKKIHTRTALSSRQAYTHFQMMSCDSILLYRESGGKNLNLMCG